MPFCRRASRHVARAPCGVWPSARRYHNYQGGVLFLAALFECVFCGGTCDTLRRVICTPTLIQRFTATHGHVRAQIQKERAFLRISQKNAKKLKREHNHKSLKTPSAPPATKREPRPTCTHTRHGTPCHRHTAATHDENKNGHTQQTVPGACPTADRAVHNLRPC